MAAETRNVTTGMTAEQAAGTLRLGLPKGRMQENVLGLLSDAGIRVSVPSRGYRPVVSLSGIEAKLLKPQNIIEMIDAGSRDVGFAGADWVAELDARVVELLDTGLDQVRLVAAAPRTLVDAEGKLPARPLVVASEYVRLSSEWIKRRGCGDRFVRSYGATEVFPPEDADCILDVTATGATLEANNLKIIEDVVLSSTRLYASELAMADAGRRRSIEDLVTVLRSVLEARRRVMLELNVSEARLEEVISVLPCMREPTVSLLHGGAGYAVKAVVKKDQVPRLIPELKLRGGSDIVISPITQVTP